MQSAKTRIFLIVFNIITFANLNSQVTIKSNEKICQIWTSNIYNFIIAQDEGVINTCRLSKKEDSSPRLNPPSLTDLAFPRGIRYDKRSTLMGRTGCRPWPWTAGFFRRSARRWPEISPPDRPCTKTSPPPGWPAFYGRRFRRPSAGGRTDSTCPS